MIDPLVDWLTVWLMDWLMLVNRLNSGVSLLADDLLGFWNDDMTHGNRWSWCGSESRRIQLRSVHGRRPSFWEQIGVPWGNDGKILAIIWYHHVLVTLAPQSSCAESASLFTQCCAHTDASTDWSAHHFGDHDDHWSMSENCNHCNPFFQCLKGRETYLWSRFQWCSLKEKGSVLDLPRHFQTSCSIHRLRKGERILQQLRRVSKQQHFLCRMNDSDCQSANSDNR